jgi:phosphatidate phosphatase PAH1
MLTFSGNTLRLIGSFWHFNSLLFSDLLLAGLKDLYQQALGASQTDSTRSPDMSRYERQ